MLKLNSNRRFFIIILATVLVAFGCSMLPPYFVAVYYKETTAMLSLGIGAAFCILSGVIMKKFVHLDSVKLRPRMNYLTTTLIWLIVIAITTVIYYSGRAEFTLIDSFFEATANLTATGIGNIDVSDYPHAFLLWRSLLNWFGGIGIILIAVSCLPKWDFSGHDLISVEVPGPEFLKSTSTFKNTYRKIIFIYIVLTAAHCILLLIAGMNFSDAVLTSLSNISTAGLQHLNNGVITDFDTSVKIIITLFAFLGSVNVSFFLTLLFNKKILSVRRTETSIYTVRIILTALLISVFIAICGYNGFFGSLGDSLMQSVSFISTSGYIVSDCYSWPMICKFLILLQMFFGACAVSTGGGIKTARAEIALRTVSFGLFRHIHPRAVKPVKSGTHSLKPVQLVRANLFIALFMFVYFAGALLLSLDNKNESIFDALIYSQAMLTNTGTSIADHNMVSLTAGFSPFSKIIMSIEMLAGRLEIYPVLMLFTRSFWKSDNNY